MIISKKTLYRLFVTQAELELLKEALHEFEDRCEVYADSEEEGGQEQKEFIEKSRDARELRVAAIKALMEK